MSVPEHMNFHDIAVLDRADTPPAPKPRPIQPFDTQSIKTSTEKVEKHVLHTQGLTANTWDRERAGIKIRRTKID